jgi:hypothetical protein
MPNYEFWTRTNSAARTATNCARKMSEGGLDIKTGFAVWKDFLRKQGGGSRVGQIHYGTKAILAEAIDREEQILAQFAVLWNPQAHFEQILVKSLVLQCRTVDGRAQALFRARTLANIDSKTEFSR